MNIEALVQQYGDYQIEMRRWFHRHPEPSEQEFETAAKIREELDKMGIKWRKCGMETGTMAVIEGAEPGRTIMLRGDIDGLSVTEDTGLPFASEKPGMMHACGHDCHISMLLTAAKILNDVKDRLKGRVVLAFQPAEEVGAGAPAMIRDGLLEGVDACFGQHVWWSLPAGTLGVCTGAAFASGDRFEIDVIGKSGHGAEPQSARDATVMGAAIVQNLQTILSREVNPIDTAVVTVGTFESGSRWNVISGRAKLTGTTRAYSREVRSRLPEQIERIASMTAGALGGEAKLTYSELVPVTINDAKMAELVRASGRKLLGDEHVVEPEPTMGGEDFGNYQEHVPGVMAFFGIQNAACGACWPQHHEKYTVDESVLVKGAAVYAQVALDFLGVDL